MVMSHSILRQCELGNTGEQHLVTSFRLEYHELWESVGTGSYFHAKIEKMRLSLDGIVRVNLCQDSKTRDLLANMRTEREALRRGV